MRAFMTFGLGLVLLSGLVLLNSAPTQAQGIVDVLNNAAAAPTPLSVSASFTVSTVGKTGVLHIATAIEANWHIYSITQPKGGPLSTKIALALPPGVELAGDFAAQPKPEIHTDNDAFPGIPLEEHRNQVVWSAPIKLPAGVDPATLQIAGKVTAQACSDVDGNCLPPKGYDFTASFKPTNSDGFREKLSKVILRGQIEPAVVQPGGKAKLTISAEPIEGFHVYALADRPKDKSDRPVLIALTETAGLQVGEVKASVLPLEKTDPDTGKSSLVHKDPVSWTIELNVPASAKPGSYSVAGLLGYQTCDAVSCLPARGARYTGLIHVQNEPSSSSAVEALSFSPAKYGEVELAKENSNATSSQPFDMAGLPLMIGFSLLGGLILNLMPCVLPVIGLKILSFVEQSGQSRGRVLSLNLWYTLGLLTVFAVLATVAVTLNQSWGQQFQSTGFNMVMAAVVFAMALSFLGVWEIPLPGFVGSGAANDLAHQEGRLGAFFKGVLTTVLATPCSGPFLGPVFGYTLKQPPVVTYIIFLSIGVGMAAPYLLIGAFPRLIKFLPKPGAWMDTFKQMLAFVLLGTVVFLFSFLKREYVVPTFGMLVAIWAGCWWIGRTPLYEGAKKLAFAWTEGLAFAAAAGSISFLLLGPVQRVLPWEPYSPSRLAQLTGEGKTVMVDFTAEWCLTCKLNLKNSIDVHAVREVIEANGVVPLLADWTDESEEIKKTLATLGSNSIPVLAIYPAGKASEPIILRDLISSRSVVIEALKQAGPSRPANTANAVNTPVQAMR